MPASINNLLEVHALVQAHGSAELSQWFGDGLQDYLDDDSTLEKCLGLAPTGDGKRSARTQYRAQQRNRFLREAWNTLDGPPTPRARKLAEAARDFESRFWPTWCNRDEPPASASLLRAALFHARQHGEIPAERQLFDLLKDSNAASEAAWFTRSLV